MDRFGLCVHDRGDRIRRDHKLRQKLFVELLHPLEKIAELLLFRSLEIGQHIRVQCVVLRLRGVDRCFVVQRRVRDARKRGDSCLYLVDRVEASKLIAEVFNLLLSVSTYGRRILQRIQSLLGLHDVLTISLAVRIGQIVGVRERVDLRIHVAAAAVCADDVKLVPGTDIVSGFRRLVVHGRPDRLAAANVDGVAAHDRDSLRALVVAAALGVVGDLLIEEALDKIVLVRRVRGDGELCRVAVDHDGVGIRSARLRYGLKLRRKNERLVAVHDLERLERRIRVVERTAEVFAKTRAGIHHMDHVAVRQLNIGILVRLHGKLRKAEVHEEAVERAHPAGLVAAIELGKLYIRPAFLRNAGKIADAELRAAGSGPFVTVIGQRAENDRHHGVLVADGVVLLVDDGILRNVVIRVIRVRIEALRCAGIGGVLDNDCDRADGGAGVEALVIFGVAPTVTERLVHARAACRGLFDGLGGVAARGADCVDGLCSIDSRNALVICGFDRNVVLMRFVVLSEDSVQRVQRVSSCLIDLARRTGDGTPCHGDGHIVKRHREVEEGILHDLVTLVLRASSSIGCAVVEVECALLRGVFQTRDLNTADGVLSAVDLEGHLAQHTRCVAF